MPTFSTEEREKLSQEAAAQLAQLKAQQKRLQLSKSNLGSLKEKYKETASWFTLVARWYGDKTWQRKRILDGQVALIACGLGLLFSFAIFVIVVAVYSALTLLFNKHNKAEKERLERLGLAIIHAEENLQAEISSFNQAQLKLLNLCQAMQEKNKALEQCMTELSEKIIVLQQAAQLLETNVTVLDAYRDQISLHTDELQGQGDDFCLRLEELMVQLIEFSRQQSVIVSTVDIVQVREEVSGLHLAVSQLSKAVERQEQISQEQSIRCSALETSIAQLKVQFAEADQELLSLQEQNEDSQRVREDSARLHERARQILQTVDLGGADESDVQRMSPSLH